MSTTILGKVACVPRGAYVSTAAYNPLDIVSYDGGSYLVTVACTGITPPNTAYYMQLAERGAAGVDGQRGATGATGAKGDKGDPGTGLEILGTYESVEALTAGVTNPAQGDMYNVGTESPYTIYMWDTTVGAGNWISQGQLQGAKGEAGATGTTFTPAVSAAGVISWTNDGGKVNPGSVSIKGPQGDQGIPGEPGIQGEQGIQGEPGPAGQSAYEAAQAGGYTGTEAEFYADLAGMEGFATFLADY